MATVIRFSRHGTKKKPYYRMVVQTKTAPRDGRFIEHIGAFDPVKGDNTIVIKRDRLDYWLSTGAIMSDSVEQKVKIWRKTSAATGTEAAAPQVKPEKPKAKAKAPKDKEA